MGLRSLNNTASSFNDPYASTGLEGYPGGTGGSGLVLIAYPT